MREIPLAYLFPGDQGADGPIVARALFEQSRSAREMFEKADDILAYRLSQQYFDSGVSPISYAKTQLGILVTAYAHTWHLYRCGIYCHLFAGWGLVGELGALVASGGISFADAINLAQEGSELIDEAARRYPGKMALIHGLDFDQVKELCKESNRNGRKFGQVSVACHARKNESIISGEDWAVDRVCQMAEETSIDGSYKVSSSPWPSIGPLNSPLMMGAAEQFKGHVKEAHYEDPRGFYSTIAGREITSGTRIANSLSHQMTTPIHLVGAVVSMCQEFVDYETRPRKVDFIELKPGGGTLSQFIRPSWVIPPKEVDEVKERVF